MGYLPEDRDPLADADVVVDVPRRRYPDSQASMARRIDREVEVAMNPVTAVEVRGVNHPLLVGAEVLQVETEPAENRGRRGLARADRMHLHRFRAVKEDQYLTGEIRFEVRAERRVPGPRRAATLLKQVVDQ